MLAVERLADAVLRVTMFAYDETFMVVAKMKGTVKVSNEKIVSVALAVMAPGTVSVFAVKFETKLFEIFEVTTFRVVILAVTKLPVDIFADVTFRVSTLANTRFPEAMLAVVAFSVRRLAVMIPKFVALPDSTFSVFRFE
jgi:hypothetical protein